MVVPLPTCCTAPLPEMTPSNWYTSDRSKFSVPWFVTSPTIDPPEPLLPNCSVPAEIVVPPA